jgi:hypothetical protein
MPKRLEVVILIFPPLPAEVLAITSLFPRRAAVIKKGV